MTPLRILIASGALLLCPSIGFAGETSRPCDKSFAEVFRAVAPSVPRVFSVAIDPFSVVKRTQIRMGSGVVLDDRSNVITNAHVVYAAGTILISMSDDDMQEAEIVGLDPISDLAIVRPKYPRTRLQKPLFGHSGELEIGEELLAIGYPLGLRLTATKGILSGTDVALPLTPMSWLTPFIQTDAALNPGNSGGPLVNRCGEVVGISTLSSGERAQNLNFAIPIDAARDIIAQLLAHGRVIRAWHGINGKLGSSDPSVRAPTSSRIPDRDDRTGQSGRKARPSGRQSASGDRDAGVCAGGRRHHQGQRCSPCRPWMRLSGWHGR